MASGSATAGASSSGAQQRLAGAAQQPSTGGSISGVGDDTAVPPPPRPRVLRPSLSPTRVRAPHATGDGAPMTAASLVRGGSMARSTDGGVPEPQLPGALPGDDAGGNRHGPGGPSAQARSPGSGWPAITTAPQQVEFTQTAAGAPGATPPPAHGSSGSSVLRRPPSLRSPPTVSLAPTPPVAAPRPPTLLRSPPSSARHNPVSDPPSISPAMSPTTSPGATSPQQTMSGSSGFNGHSAGRPSGSSGSAGVGATSGAGGAALRRPPADGQRSPSLSPSSLPRTRAISPPVALNTVAAAQQPHQVLVVGAPSALASPTSSSSSPASGSLPTSPGGAAVPGVTGAQRGARRAAGTRSSGSGSSSRPSPGRTLGTGVAGTTGTAEEGAAGGEAPPARVPGGLSSVLGSLLGRR